MGWETLTPASLLVFPREDGISASAQEEACPFLSSPSLGCEGRGVSFHEFCGEAAALPGVRRGQRPAPSAARDSRTRHGALSTLCHLSLYSTTTTYDADPSEHSHSLSRVEFALTMPTLRAGTLLHTGLPDPNLAPPTSHSSTCLSDNRAPSFHIRLLPRHCAHPPPRWRCREEEARTQGAGGHTYLHFSGCSSRLLLKSREIFASRPMPK